ncbi:MULTISPECIES: GNAT family N-acetyltransferase [unclassified Bacillus (in: firmicutes)]|uniref:GNAT family N-acetyltransferase n=1 Tax=unclassified Bacillus (in: firmicutes) TaxID=185979 RepID=UPI0008F337E4|nr:MULTISPECIES: GNAT family N-acetyltransferase [unclassified Bacillus (in: firmicutes)]SFA85931.1 Acetyltransferase (GNAT) family protein [Bacillus sp. UNCCL13]SFQ83548.1 Acetyltransferase (GNAT) family protein [Bacillus sp. cl95]
MKENLKIIELKSTNDYREKLSELLIKVVEDGASVGFLPPLDLTEANQYWDSVLKPEVILFIATVNDELAGSIQLHMSSKENGKHRAEIAKLMTSPDFRRMGIGKILMENAEKRAKSENISLIVLDTREGDPSNNLYQSFNYIEAGRIPHYAKSADGELHSTVFYYKEL